TLVRVEHVDQLGVLIPERHVECCGSDVLPGSVIVLLRPAREDLNVRDRLAVHAVVTNIVSDTSVDLNACICHVVFLLCFVALKMAPTGMVEAVGLTWCWLEVGPDCLGRISCAGRCAARFPDGIRPPPVFETVVNRMVISR